MRFHPLAFSSAVLLAVSAFQGFNNFAFADEAAIVTDTETNAEAITDEFEPVKGTQHKFQAEVSNILDIVVNSLYQNKDVFLRELISNASDALDKIRFLSITKPELLGLKTELEIRVSYDSQKKTLTITDSGIGMTKEELINNLGTVANSGTTKFMNAIQEGAAEISQIGMFGVGFYASFLVANRVDVATKSASGEKQHVWSSKNGQDEYYIGEDPRGDTLGRGTEITLFLKDDAEEYADFGRLEQLVHHYSEFITHPIFVRKTESMEVEDDEEEEEVLEDVDADVDTDADTEEPKDDEDALDVSEEEDSDAEVDSDEEAPPKPKKMKTVTTHEWVKSNADAAIWNRAKDDVTDAEYQEFYKMITKDAMGSDAASWSHFDAEGNINFKSLVYMPSQIPQSFQGGQVNNFKSSMKLYVRKVLISDDFELLPKYMSFVTGVVDSDDLPLNVNRETLQESKIISIIRKKVTRKVIDMLKKFADSPMPEEEEKEPEIDDEGNIIETEEKEEEKKVHPYIEWYEKFSPSIKMGVVEDESNRKRLSKLVRCKTSKSDGKYVSFEDYVANMKDWQKDIYFLAGQNQDELEKSPFMEKFNEKDVEVIYFTEPADEYMVSHMRDFDGKRFSTITHDNISFGDEDEDLKKRRAKAYSEKFDPLVKFMNKFYGRAVGKVMISNRLGSSPAIVSSGEFGQSANQERIMRAQAFAHGQDAGGMMGMKTLEINPRHPFFEALLEMVPADEEEKPDLETRDALWTLLDTALLNGGYHINEGKGFNHRMMRSIKRNLGTDTFDLLPEIDPKVEEDVAPEIDEFASGINLEDFDMDEMDEFKQEL